MSFHRHGDVARLPVSQASWCSPVMVRPGSSIAGSSSADPLAAIAPQVQHRQVDELPELQPPVDLRPVAWHRGARDPHRHPLVVRLLRCCAHDGVRPLPRRLVLVRAVRPAPVRDLVVVPRDDERHGGVQRLEVGVGLVLRMPAAIVVQAHDLVRRIVPADVLVEVAVRVLAGLVLVQVVPEVDHRVEVAALGKVPVGAEPARPASWHTTRPRTAAASGRCPGRGRCAYARQATSPGRPRSGTSSPSPARARSHRP